MREQAQHERSAEPNWLPYFTVANVDHAVRTAEQAYGRQLSPTIEVKSGRLAVIADPQGRLRRLRRAHGPLELGTTA
jgi:predicted enzyme related to lactoylglutathione lyase